MKCPQCGFPESKVTNSREANAGEEVRRRRECLSCGARFTTREVVEKRLIVVIKRDGTREPFDRRKLIHGLSIACRKRPVGLELIERLAEGVERQLLRRNDPEVPTNDIGDLVLNALRDLDDVAYVRFASVYRQFQNVDEFSEELRRFRRH